MSSDSLGNKAIKGAIWASIDRFGGMAIQFLVNLVLARILLPSDFGAIGMLTIFIVVSQTIIDSGFGAALIQKKEPTQTDYSSIFFWNVGFSIALYIILFFCAPFIADFYKMPILSPVLKIWGISLLLSSLYSIQYIRLRKNLKFKQLAFNSIFSYSLASIISIIMAYHGWGVWSLVNMYITNGILSLLILWIISKWKPSLSFSFNSIKNLFSFGGYLMSASILQQISQNIQGIIIGKRFSASDMGYFSQADKLNSVVSSSIPNIITQVMYPVFSNIQDDRDRLQQMLLINLRIISFIIFPLMGVLIIIAQPLIVGLYGEKWLPSVPIFQILCVSGFFICLQNINFYAVAAVGASKALFNWSFYKWGFLLAAILIGMIWGLYGIIWGMVLSSLNIFLVNAYLASKKADVPFNLQLLSILPSAGIIMISMIIGFFLLFIQINPWFVGIVTILCYFLFSFIFKLKAIKETQYFLKSLLKKV